MSAEARKGEGGSAPSPPCAFAIKLHFAGGHASLCPPYARCDATGAPAKSLIRMFGPRGNPQAKNLFAVIGYLQKKAGLHLRVAA